MAKAPKIKDIKIWKKKPKKVGKAKKAFGPKEQKPKAYRGQGR
jgi:hypothetical protein